MKFKIDKVTPFPKKNDKIREGDFNNYRRIDYSKKLVKVTSIVEANITKFQTYQVEVPIFRAWYSKKIKQGTQFDSYGNHDSLNKEDYIKLKKNWYFDQKALKSNLDTFAESNSDRIIKLNDNDAGFCRLDRGYYSIFFNLFYDKKKIYSDFHMPRPYVKYKKTINKVYDLHFSGLQ